MSLRLLLARLSLLEACAPRFVPLKLLRLERLVRSPFVDERGEELLAPQSKDLSV